MTYKIKDVTKKNPRSNRYCGPAAMSAILGITTDEAAATLREVTGRRSIKCTHGYEIHSALQMYGVRMQQNYREVVQHKGESFRNWAKRTIEHRGFDRVFLVSAGKHWRVVQGWNQVCGIVKSVSTIANAHAKGSIVKAVYEVFVDQRKDAA